LRAVILAGGRATRLYPVTLYMPKQLIMINGHPAIHYIFNHCRKAGIKDFTLCISNNFLKEHFTNALGDGSDLGINITYSVDPESTGTSGRVHSAEKTLKGEENFLVYYGDIITGFKMKDMIKLHEIKKGTCTIATSSSKVLEFGTCSIDENRGVTNFVERPAISDVSDVVINCGIAVCNKKVLRYCKQNDDFFGDTIPELLKEGLGVNAFDIKSDFYDIGSYSIIERILAYLKRDPELSDLDAIKGRKFNVIGKRKNN